MSESKVTAAHLRRAAVVYVRQSTMAQLSPQPGVHHPPVRPGRTGGRVGLAARAVRVIDDDLGVSGASATGRSGFAELAAQVGLGQVGIVLALEVSRLARNNADWYRLLDLAGMTDTLIADTDGVYHPGVVQRPDAAGYEGHHVRGRTAHPARPPRRRDPQQGRPRRAAPRAAGRAGVGRGRRRDPLAPRRGRHRRDRRDLRAVRRVRVGARGVAVAARAGLEVPAATPRPTCAARRSPGSSRPTMRCTTCSPTPPTPAPTSSAGPASQRSVDADGRLRVRRRGCRRASGRCSSPSIIAGSSTGTPSRPTRLASAPTPARGRTSRAPARSARAARCCRAWPPAGPAGANSPSTTTARPRPPPATTAPAPAQLVEGRGTRHLRVGGAGDRRRGRRGVPGRAAAGRAAGLPGRRPAARRRPRHRAGAVAPPGRAGAAMRPAAPSAATAPSTRTTGWSPAAWRPSGTPRCKPSPTPRPNSPAAKPRDRKP